MKTPLLCILHLNSMLKGGGTDDQCVKLAAKLHRLGHTVWIAGPDNREFSKNIRDTGISFFPTPVKFFAKLRFIFAAAKLIRREKIQIVHGHHGRDIWPTIFAAKLSGVRPKVVLTRHMAKSPASWFSRRFMLGQCDALIAVSEFVAKILREGVYEPDSPEPERRARPPTLGDYSKIHIAHGGIDTEKFRPFDASAQRREWNLSPEHFVFAVAGAYSLPRGKGQREFLQAAARIHQKIPNARFLIVGRGNMKTILENDIQLLGLAGKAWLTPYCRNMPAAMNAMDCLVLPQIGTEAFGLVICEAHACGKPVIASALDGIPEAFQAGGYGQLVQPENVEELAAAMETMANRPRLNESQRRELHEQISRKFSIGNATQHVLEIYQLLVGENFPSSLPRVGRWTMFLNKFRTLIAGAFGKCSPSSEWFGPPKGVCHSLKNWCDKHGATFQFVSEKNLNGHAPLSIEIGQSQGNIAPAPFIALLSNGRVYGRHSVAVLNSDDHLVAELGDAQVASEWRPAKPAKEHPVFRQNFLPRVHRIKGRACVLAVPGGNTYYHWMLEVLPRLEILRASGISLDTIDFFIVNGRVRPFQSETLRHLRLFSKAVSLDEFPHVKADVLIAPSYAGISGDPAPWILSFLRKTFLPPAQPENKFISPRFYISRARAKNGRVVNENSLVETLALHGFKPVCLEDLTVAEQVALFAQAEAVVGLHGSGFSNLVFCRPQIKVFEFFSPRLKRRMYERIAGRMNLNYFSVAANLPSDASRNERRNVIVDVAELDALLKTEL